jgi:hypothetical protein
MDADEAVLNKIISTKNSSFSKGFKNYTAPEPNVRFLVS